MKSLLIAMAVIAPVCGANAFTVSEENSGSSNINLTEVNPKCDNIAHDTYYLWLGSGFSSDTAKDKAREAKDACEKELKADKKDLSLTPQNP